MYFKAEKIILVMDNLNIYIYKPASLRIIVLSPEDACRIIKRLEIKTWKLLIQQYLSRRIKTIDVSRFKIAT